jgi:lysozyme family protein
MDITKAFSILQQFEGGNKVTNTANDKGGLTKYGISQAAYPHLDINSLTEEQAIDLYRKDYWSAAGCAGLKQDLQYIHFDTAVIMGIVRAIKILQQACGINVDGILGPETLIKSNDITPTDYLFFRLVYYNTIMANDNSQFAFCKGWTNRVSRLFLMYKNGELS